MRRSFFLFMTVHSPRAIPFELGGEDATRRAVDKYQSRWLLGAKTEFLDMKTPVPEFVPFFFCNGSVRATFVGTAHYRTTSTDASGKSRSSSHSVTTGLLELESTYHENTTQLYGGYKYNNKHIHSALRHESNALKMQKISEVDVSCGSIGLFEVSTSTMKILLADEVKRQMRERAEAQVRLFHSSANSINISFKTFDLTIDNVYPTFVPCYVIKAGYDGEEYTLYVSGSMGTVGGPYLINALQVARMTALGTFGLTMLTATNKAAAFLTGSVLSVVAYVVAFYAAKYFPAWRRDYYRRQREAERQKFSEDNRSGFTPSQSSQRITEEYHRSSYWDTHQYQQKKKSTSNNDTSSSSSGASGGAGVRDVKGYYKRIGVSPDASVNDIRSAFRQRVLMQHPDAGGSNESMMQLNEAYRTLRDPKLRDAYDRS